MTIRMTNYSIEIDVPAALQPLLHVIPSLAPELEKESDRGCALVIGCIVEQYLFESIKLAVAVPSKARLFMGKGRFAQGLDSAELLGVISARDRSALDAVFKIRSRFAHVAEPGRDFSNPEVAQEVDSLYEIYRPGFKGKTAQMGARKAYVAFALSLCSLLLARADSVAQRSPPADLSELSDRLFYWWSNE